MRIDVKMSPISILYTPFLYNLSLALLLWAASKKRDTPSCMQSHSKTRPPMSSLLQPPSMPNNSITCCHMQIGMETREVRMKAHLDQQQTSQQSNGSCQKLLISKHKEPRCACIPHKRNRK